MVEYAIEQVKPGLPEVDVTKDRRAFIYDCYDVEEAVRRIARDPGFDPEDDVVMVIHPDGYRERLDRLSG